MRIHITYNHNTTKNEQGISGGGFLKIALYKIYEYFFRYDMVLFLQVVCCPTDEKGNEYCEAKGASQSHV